MPTPRLLALSASTRQGSLNTKLCHAAAERLGTQGAEVTIVDLADYPMPLYQGDLEAKEGIPATTRALKALFAAHDGYLIASPEYNGFFSPLLKNTIDWLSRRDGDEPPMIAFKGKTAAIIAASPGANGGMRALPAVRQLLSGLGVMVVPAQYALKHAGKAFDDEGRLIDEAASRALDRVAGELVRITGKLAGE